MPFCSCLPPCPIIIPTSLLKLHFYLSFIIVILLEQPLLEVALNCSAFRNQFVSQSPLACLRATKMYICERLTHFYSYLVWHVFFIALLSALLVDLKYQQEAFCPEVTRPDIFGICDLNLTSTLEASSRIQEYK